MFFPGMAPVFSWSSKSLAITPPTSTPTTSTPTSSFEDRIVYVPTTTASPRKKKSRHPPVAFRLPTEDEEKAEREKGIAGTSTGVSGSGVSIGSNDEQPMVTSPSKPGTPRYLQKRSQDSKDGGTWKSAARLLAFGNHIPKECVTQIYPEYKTEKERLTEVSKESSFLHSSGWNVDLKV